MTSSQAIFERIFHQCRNLFRILHFSDSFPDIAKQADSVQGHSEYAECQIIHNKSFFVGVIMSTLPHRAFYEIQ